MPVCDEFLRLTLEQNFAKFQSFVWYCLSEVKKLTRNISVGCFCHVRLMFWLLVDADMTLQEHWTPVSSTLAT